MNNPHPADLRGSGVNPLKMKPLDARVEVVALVSIAIETGDKEQLLRLLKLCKIRGYDHIAERIKRNLK